MNQELENFVKTSRVAGKRDEGIRQELSRAGWRAEDVEGALKLSGGAQKKRKAIILASEGGALLLIAFVIFVWAYRSERVTIDEAIEHYFGEGVAVQELSGVPIEEGMMRYAFGALAVRVPDYYAGFMSPDHEYELLLINKKDMIRDVISIGKIGFYDQELLSLFYGVDTYEEAVASDVWMREFVSEAVDVYNTELASYDVVSLENFNTNEILGKMYEIEFVNSSQEEAIANILAATAVDSRNEYLYSLFLENSNFARKDTRKEVYKEIVRTLTFID